MEMKRDHRSNFFFKFKLLEGRSLKNIRASTGFEPVTSGGSNPVEASQLLKLEINCDDHSSLSSTTAVQI